jgi:toluene monooxygenase electron transfer component
MHSPGTGRAQSLARRFTARELKCVKLRANDENEAMKDFAIHIQGCGGDTLFRQREGERSLLRSALRAGIGFPYECHSGGCGSCRFELLEGEVDVLWPQAPGWSERDRRRNRYLACQCVAMSDLRIKAGVAAEYCPAVLPHVFQARLSAAVPVTHDILELRFVAEDPADFAPGQYALMQLPGVDGARAYSMCNLPNRHGEWHFQIRRVPAGRGTTYLAERLRPGDGVELEGPYGLAYLRTGSPRDIVCVAGGSGLAPMVSIARGAAAAQMFDSRQLHFFYGGRLPRDICGEAFLRDLPGYGDRIHYYPVVSLPEYDSSTDWKGGVGFVHEQVRRTLADRIKDFEFYFAGPPPMTQTLQEMLMVQYQVPFEQIHYDRFF